MVGKIFIPAIVQCDTVWHCMTLYNTICILFRLNFITEVLIWCQASYRIRIASKCIVWLVPWCVLVTVFPALFCSVLFLSFSPAVQFMRLVECHTISNCRWLWLDDSTPLYFILYRTRVLFLTSTPRPLHWYCNAMQCNGWRTVEWSAVVADLSVSCLCLIHSEI